MVALLATLFAFQAAAQHDKTINSKLEEVTVFITKAQLTNTASTTIEKGLTNLVITGLPASVDHQSLSVAAEGDFLLQGVMFRNNYQKANDEPPHIRKLRDSIDYYRDRVKIHNDQIEILQKEEELLMANQSVKGDEGLEVAMLEEVSDFFRQRMTKIRMLILQERKVEARMRRRFNAVEQQVNQYSFNATKATGEVFITISADAHTKAGFTLTYMVYDAGWSAFYDLRATSTTDPVKLIYKANVHQNTGLDWNDVTLTLSSGTPGVGANKPELYPWSLSVIEPKPKGKRVGLAEEEKSAGLDDWGSSDWGDDSGNYDPEMAGAVDSETMADYTGVSETILAVEFKLRLPYSIPSDAHHHPIELQQYNLKALYQHMAVPKLDTRAFLVARVSGWDEYNLLPGDVNTYYAGTFVGSSFLDANTTADTLTISLGVDKNVIVTREKIKDFKSKSFFGGSSKESSGYKIAVRNSKAEPVSIQIEDQLPVSANSQITVEPKELSGGRINPTTGQIAWTINVKPGETRSVDLKFDVKYPKGVQLRGL